MVGSGLLILLFTAFCVWAFRYLVRRDFLAGSYFGWLFVYTFFTQLGYVVYPDLAQERRVYFGPGAFYPYWSFVALSFLALFAVLAVILRNPRRARLPVISTRWPTQAIVFRAGVVAFVLWIAGYALANANEISYVQQAVSEGGQSFAYAFALHGSLTIIVFATWRSHASSRLDWVYLSWLLGFTTLGYVVIAVITGDRSALLSIVLGLSSYEVLLARDRRVRLSRTVVMSLALGFLAVLLMQRIANVRGTGDLTPSLFLQHDATSGGLDGGLRGVIDQDYFTPSALLMASMNYGYVDPAEVVRSNFMNALVFQNYPTLSETVGGLLAKTTRKQGFAYYVLVEGYNFAGWWGIAYNAAAIGFGLWLWRRLLSTTDPTFTRVMEAVACSQAVALVRSQTCYFAKNFYLILLPSMALVYLAIGLRISLTRGQHRSPGALRSQLGRRFRG